MIGKNIVAGSFDSMAAAFKSSNFSKPSSVSGDFSKTMSAVQDNQAKSAENKKSNTDFAKGMKKLTDSDKPAMDSDKRLEAKKNTKSLKETQDIDSENAVVLASSQIQASQLLEQGLGELEEKITELLSRIQVEMLERARAHRQDSWARTQSGTYPPHSPSAHGR